VRHWVRLSAQQRSPPDWARAQTLPVQALWIPQEPEPLFPQARPKVPHWLLGLVFAKETTGDGVSILAWIPTWSLAWIRSGRPFPTP
jgi:hypothetical protein